LRDEDTPSIEPPYALAAETLNLERTQMPDYENVLTD
jgi:hypothetical protein